MAKVEIVNSLAIQIKKKFKGETHDIIKLFRSLEVNPNKGKSLGHAGGILIKELKYKNFRFYFIVDGQKLRMFSGEQLRDLLIKFVRMSDKKDQQKTINEIKQILRNVGDSEF